MGALKLAATFLAIVNAAPYDIRQTSAIDPDDYVYVNGTRLYDSNGLHYITGMNYWACMNLAADASAGGNYSRLVIELDQMAGKGINHLRIMAASEGAPTPQPFRMNPALMEAPGKYNDKIFEGLDICLDEMSKRGMRATMTLNNEWQWSGGFAQYVSWATNDSKIPYPSSWNLTAPPQRATPGTGWGAYTVVGTNAAPYNEFTNYANRMYGIEQAETWYKNHIKTVMTRKNTINGRIYNADPTVMTWQLANEPQAAYTGANTTPDDALFPWVDRISTYIRTMSPKQLISVGLESKQGEYYFKQVHKHKNVDYATSHLWVQNWGYYSDLDPTKLSLWTALTFAKNFLQDTSKWASDVGKPIFLEEFGMARNNWENTFKDYRYLSSAGTSHKDEYFNAVIGRVMDDFRSGRPYIGTSPWAYGGVYRPETQRVNQFGFLGAGDPPHESPGWYDLYDTDEAMNIVHSQQKNIAEWIENNS